VVLLVIALVIGQEMEALPNLTIGMQITIMVIIQQRVVANMQFSTITILMGSLLALIVMQVIHFMDNIITNEEYLAIAACRYEDL
jgi:hypothetical protein